MERLIDLHALARVRDMELVARSVARGFLFGMQPSEQRGVGIEFSQYRSYEPGDAPARIDWKLYARSDRYFVREAERESETDVWLVLDSSRSMALSSESGAFTKFDYARHLMATLAYIALTQGDRAGLLVLGAEKIQRLSPATGMRQWHRILHALESVQAVGEFPAADSLNAHLAQLQGSGLTLLLTDLHEQSGEIRDFVRRARTAHNELAVLALECADEADFPFSGPVRFEDLETGESVLASGRAAKKRYLEARTRWWTDWALQLAQWQVSVDAINVDEPLDHALVAFFRRRHRGQL